MDGLILARLQFAATTVYHFFFVPLTLGLSVLTAIFQTLWLTSGKEDYKKMAKYWGKLFLINFAMGVVTGIVQEFQFGMNWSEYSRYVGDIFGAPLAIEALLAFFLESTFIGVWIFGWDRIPKKLHTASIWLVAIGANVSALWILIANSFMQQPVGYMINEATGRAEMTDFFALIGNEAVWEAFPHTIFSGFATAAFFVLGISAYHLVRKNHEEFFKQSFKIAAIFGLFASGLVILTGHSQAQHMVAVQPMKMATAEYLYETSDPADLSLLTIDGVVDIRIPGALSFLVYNKFDGEVKGINELQAAYETEFGPGDYTPPIALNYWSFRIMVFAGFAMIALTALGVFLVFRKKGFTISKLLSTVLLLSMALPYLANTFGWILTEVGRWPWTVYGLLKVSDSVSPTVSNGELWMTLIGYVVVYGVLMVADVYLLAKYAKAGPDGVMEAAKIDAQPSIISGTD
jgi:cytochrome d ubiquinol oxidase subunit I